MANLPLLERDDVAPADRELLDNFADLHRVLVHSPEAFRRVLSVGRYLRRQSPLAARLRELAVLRVAYLLRSPYEWSHHLALAEACAISDADIRGVMRGAPFQGFAPAERMALEIAGAMTLLQDVPPAMIGKLSAAIGHRQVVDLLVAISHYNALARTIAALGVEVEGAYQEWLQRYPLLADPASREAGNA
jgi:alkylhydroperoxidase family enzyme